MSRKIMLLVFVTAFLMTVPAVGDDLPAKVKGDLDKAGLKVYPGAVYCTGSLQMGIRFATSDSPEKVRAWYQEQYPEWSVQDKYGTWSFYDGPPGQGPGAIMGTRNMVIQFNGQVPGWHSLADNMTTEIMMAAP